LRNSAPVLARRLAALLVLVARACQQLLLGIEADGAAVVSPLAISALAIEDVQQLPAAPHAPRRPGRGIRDVVGVWDWSTQASTLS
jgi:hypothetical protein